MNQKKLFLFDAMALIYRAHFAFINNPRINTKGVNTGATLGFTNSLLEVIKKEQPTHMIVAYDTPEPTFRSEIYEEYKAHRDAQPEDITVAIEYTKQICRGFGIPVMEKPGYEADDVLGTLAYQAEAKGLEVYIMTPDKDFAQLVKEHVFLYRPSSKGNGVSIMGVKEVLEKWEVERVDQVRDILGLQGDAVDNIPGIPKVGEKTAKKLIKEFDNVENLVQNAEQLKGKLRENVITFGEQGILSKELATIHTDVPIQFDLESSQYHGPDEKKLKAIFQTLELRTLSKRLFEDPSSSKSQQTSLLGSQDETFTSESEHTESFESIASTKHAYQLIDTEPLQKKLLDNLSQQKVVSCYCFTSKGDPYHAKLLGIAFSYGAHEAYYLPIAEADHEILALLKPFFENEKIQKVGYDLKNVWLLLKKRGIEMRGVAFDVLIAHSLTAPEIRHDLVTMAHDMLNYNPMAPPAADIENVNVLKDYACEYSDLMFQLREKLVPAIEAEKIHSLFYEVEMPLVRVLAIMEFSGVSVDVPVLRTLSNQMDKSLAKLEKSIHEMAGTHFNIASPKQLGVVLFEHLKLEEKPSKTKSGQYATGEAILEKLAKKHKIAKKIMEFRELQKLKSTYIDALPVLVHPEDGRIHTSYNQAVVATGRLSSTNPNLQNIPIRTEKGRAIREAFIPSDQDRVIVSVDYSQVELRVMAAFSKDEHMIKAFEQGQDIHAATASKLFKTPIKEVTEEMRRKAKMVNFGIIYGISPFGLAQRLSIPRSEGAEIIDAYFSEFPKIKAYMDQTIEKARESGYSATYLGRKRFLRDINSRNATTRGFAERNAINMLIQGTAAELIKLAMLRICEWMEKEQLQSRMIMQIHDELVFDVHKEELSILEANVKKFMTNALPLGVPFEVSLGVGDNWLIAHGGA